MWSTDKMGGVPTVIGECGIPFNMHGQYAYKVCKKSNAHVSLALVVTEQRLLTLSSKTQCPTRTGK
jgi:hypothetical protein